MLACREEVDLDGIEVIRMAQYDLPQPFLPLNPLLGIRPLGRFQSCNTKMIMIFLIGQHKRVKRCLPSMLVGMEPVKSQAFFKDRLNGIWKRAPEKDQILAVKNENEEHNLFRSTNFRIFYLGKVTAMQRMTRNELLVRLKQWHLD